MSQQQRDPYPMVSDQAIRMGKVGEGKVSWNPMGTEAGAKIPSAASGGGGGGASSSSSETADANENLVTGGGGRTKKKKTTGDDDDDVYADVDKDDDGIDKMEDTFLDRPAWESRPGNQNEAAIVRALEGLYKRLYGDKLPPSEMLRVFVLATTLFFMIGGYWLLRSLKDPVLTALCGVSVIPKAKMLSVFVVLAVVTVYNSLLDSNIPKHRLFYVFGTFYFALFCVIALLLMHPTIGIQNEQQSPYRILGWISYCSIESFGSVMVSLFWSFSNSINTLEVAKASYGVMVATAQVGSILGPTVVQTMAHSWGPARCYLVGAFCMLLLQGTMYFYISIYGVAEVGTTKKKERAGVLEGLKLFYDHNYVKGIFAISCLFMVEVTIVDYTMKVLARDYFADEYPCMEGMNCYDTSGEENHGMSVGATAAFTSFMGFFGQATNTLSFLLSLLGTSAVIRYLGLRLTLLLFPSICLAVIIFVRLHPTLYVVFGAMMTLKACSYALNNPTKEMLYQPTSSGVKYKAKSWIDIFGARGSKAIGSVVTNAFSDNAAILVANGSLVGMTVATFLIWNATYMGRKFDEYVADGYIVGATEEDHNNHNGTLPVSEENNIDKASKQNDNDDTSCAIYEDDKVGPEEEGQAENSSSSSKKPDVTMV